jgi:hypothetical protein
MRISPARPALLLAATALVACGPVSLGSDRPGPAAADQRQDVRGALTAIAAPPPPAGRLPATRRALRVTLGPRSPASYAELLQEHQGRRLWRTPEGFALATDGARVVATAGQPQMIVATRLDGADPLSEPASLLRGEVATRRLVDLATADRDPRGMRFGLSVDCRVHAEAAPDDPALLIVQERCRGPAPIGGFANRFYLRLEDGAVLRSEQWIGPGLPMLAMEAVGDRP